VGGQVRFLNGYDCRILQLSSWYLPADALGCPVKQTAKTRKVVAKKRKQMQLQSSKPHQHLLQEPLSEEIRHVILGLETKITERASL